MCAPSPQIQFLARRSYLRFEWRLRPRFAMVKTPF